MKKIHWRPILNYPLYWVSSDGRVKTFNSRTKILKHALYKGYVKVSLGGDTKRLHRLVAKAFKRPVLGMDEVNHIDANKQNNNHWNLEWTNHLGNMQHCDRLGLRAFRSGEDHGGTKLTVEKVLKMRELYAAKITSFPKLSREYGVSISSAQRIVNKQTWKYV